MHKLFFILIAFALFFYSCDDGDIITVEFDFEDTFEACGDVNLVLYKTKNEPAESLSVFISKLSVPELLAVDENGIFELERPNSIFNYRTYNNPTVSGLFCNDIPPSNIIITNDDVSSCTAKIKTVLTEDDGDGIPAELEDLNGNGNLEDDDTDEDGIPNYIDADDDGDNILTKDENPDPNKDGILDDAQNTNANHPTNPNNIPDYLDKDDDGDGVNTRDEENDSPDQNPANDITNDGLKDYLNPKVSTSVPATSYRQHTIFQTYKVTLNVTDINLRFLTQEVLDFGVLSNSLLSKSRTGAPVFK